jgi:hypothetical protein
MKNIQMKSNLRIWLTILTIALALPGIAHAQWNETCAIGTVTAVPATFNCPPLYPGSQWEDDPLTGGGTKTSGPFTATASTVVNPDQDFQVSVVFNPTTPGAYSAGFDFTYNSNLTLYVYITGTYQGPPSIFYPAYQVTSIIYAPPGNRSSNGYTNSTTDGTTTTVGSSFTAGSSITYTSGGDFLGLGGTLSVTFGASVTTGNSHAFSETFTDGAGVSLASQSSNPNAINHGQDLFLIWLNPAVSITPTGSTTANYSVGTQSSASGTPEEVDTVEVSAITMEANSSGVTTVPGAILGPQDDSSGHPTLPGLALICANHAAYPNCTTANQCGCVAKDFAAILALDPLLHYTTTESPLSADTSGATACANPAPSDKCRYVPVPNTPGGSQQEVETLQGPECQGCDFINNTFTQTDQDTTTQTLSESSTQTVMYTWKVDLFDEEGGPTLTSANQFMWTEMESTGKINGTANSLTVTLSSATVDCSEDVPVFEDTVFHTFVFQQPANNTSCP